MKQIGKYSALVIFFCCAYQPSTVEPLFLSITISQDEIGILFYEQHSDLPWMSTKSHRLHSVKMKREKGQQLSIPLE